MGLSLILAVPLNVAGFFGLMSAAIGWHQAIWPALLVPAVILAVMIYVMDARGVVAATYTLGWNLAHERNLFGSAQTSPPDPSRTPVTVRIVFSLIMSLASTVGLVFWLLHSDIESARQQDAADLNADAFKSATAFVADHLKDAKKRRQTAEDEVASLNDAGPANDGYKHPIIARVLQLRSDNASLGAKLAEQQEKRSRAATLMDCENRGGFLSGCTGHPGEKEAYHQAEKLFNDAIAEIGILTPQYEAVHSGLLSAEKTLSPAPEGRAATSSQCALRCSSLGGAKPRRRIPKDSA